ncbi:MULTISPECIES: type II secretion system F family protein [unclassified Xanthobacter]|uniref:type II secretion system F family protein n=1 Tax=unclassified Xanthobacter TaxID=2623496 RepID=UPI001F288871|nr:MULTISPECIES: type II secretion system F family protein [unclassified Xanthobacter]
MVNLAQATIAAICAATAVIAAGIALTPDAKERRITDVLNGITGGGLVTPRAVRLQERASEALTRILNLRGLLTKSIRDKLQAAGLRRTRDETLFLAARLLVSFAAVLGGFACAAVIEPEAMSTPVRALMVGGIGYMGWWLPERWLEDNAKKRSESIRESWPDALDLMLILVISGKSVEDAMRRMAADIGARSPFLAEEVTVLLSELSILDDRRDAYANFGRRCGVSDVRSACVAIVQAEEQGTPLADTFRNLASSGRAERISNAEKKAASRAAMLPVPTIVFFIPPLLIVGAVPMVIEIMASGGIF